MLHGLYLWARELVQPTLPFHRAVGGKEEMEQIPLESTRLNTNVLVGFLHSYEGVRQVA